MRKVFSIALVVIYSLFLVSCGEAASEKTDSAQPQLSVEGNIQETSGYKIIVNVPLGANSKTNIDHEMAYRNAADISVINTRISKQYMKEPFKDIDTWYEYIENQFGINLKVNYISPIHNSRIYSGDYYIEKIKNNEMSGLILIEFGNYNSMAVLKDSGYIVPLDDYLDISDVYSEWPGEMKKAGKMADNQTWFIPAGYNQQIYGRFYKSKWLENLNLREPTNLDELYKIIKAFTYDDPNGNGANDEKAIRGMVYDGPGTYGDIFLANEYYLTNEFMTSISYDYSTRAYEDAALKPEMKQALQYIDTLITENLVEICTTFNYLESDLTGMFYGKNDIAKNDGYQFQYILNPDSDYLAMGISSDRYYALAHGTENPESVVNGFLKTFYTDTKGMFSGMYGINEKNYTVEDKTLTVNERQRINLIDNLPYLNDYKFNKIVIPAYDSSGMFTYTLEGFDSSVIPENNAPVYLNSMYELYTELYNQKKLIIDPVIFPHKNSNTFNGLFSKYFVLYFSEMYYKKSVDDFLSFYRNEMKKRGAQQILDDLNNEAGTSAKYGY